MKMLFCIQITVAGLGSGGTSILALMANTEARTYFHRAWISGASSKFDGSKEDTYTSNTNTILRLATLISLITSLNSDLPLTYCSYNIVSVTLLCYYELDSCCTVVTV